MDSAKQQLAEKLKSAKNVLVTVSRDPSVDQLSALLGLSLLLNKQGKHCAAVFSGNIPSTLDFLKPEETIERNTDSLRDFIIALDKNKADKLRYKVEDNIVRIFITPYRTSISQEDLNFSQGDFNVDVVVALGVREQTDLDEVITAHGRILHDAVVASINLTSDGGLGAISWHEPGASSLSELVTELAQAIGDNLLDEQISTALLTGIVSETDRFSNNKTSSHTMSISATLMAAGANQQLVATKLEETVAQVPAQPQSTPLGKELYDKDQTSPDDAGTLKISHNNSANTEPDKPDDQFDNQNPDSLSDNSANSSPEIELPPPAEDLDQTPAPYLQAEQPAPQEANQIEPINQSQLTGVNQNSRLITEPPTMGGTLTASFNQGELEPTTDPFSLPQAEPPQLFERKQVDFTSGNDSQVAADPNQNIPAPAPPPSMVNPTPDNGAVTPPAFDQNAKDFSQPPAWVPPTPPAPPTPPITDSNATAVPPEVDSPNSNFTPPPPSWTPPTPPAPPEPPKPSDVTDLSNVNFDESGTLKQIEEQVHSPHLEESDKPDTLRQLEEAVHSPHLNTETALSTADNAREEVNKALSASATDGVMPPIDALNAQPLGAEIHPTVPDFTPQPVASNSVAGTSNPPPVPPPIPFDFGKTS